MKKKATLAKPTTQALITEQSLHFHGLLINPQTGQKNEYTLSLEAHWFLRVILNEVLKDPGNDFFKFERGTYDPLWFRFTSTFVGSVTRPDFSAEFLIYRDSFS